MIELFQFPWSPFCIVQRRLLEYSEARFKIVNIPQGDRSIIWKLTRQRYYAVPIIRDGRTVVFETDEDSQVVAKYIDGKCELGLFPSAFSGVQKIVWRFFEREIESIGFKLNDIYYREFVPQNDRLSFIRHKDRKFGHGCLELWTKEQPGLLQDLEQRLQPCEQMLVDKPFLLGEKPLFVDFNLYGMLGNFLYSGHYEMPAAHTRLAAWHKRMSQIVKSDF